MTSSKPPATPFLGLIGVLAAALAGSLAIGTVAVPPGEILRALSGAASDPLWDTIVREFRLPKALVCVIAGASLALGGLLMQTLFRNPLAGPDVMGLNSGASLAVGLATLSGMTYSGFTTSPWVLAASASLGSAAVFLLMLLLSARVRDNTGLLILGLMVGTLAYSTVGVLEYLSNAEDLQFFVFWTLGRVGGLSMAEIGIMGICLVTATLLGVSQIKPLNAWALGSRYAESLGVNLARSRIIFLLATSLLVGSVTAFCGPIAFVGIAVPHLVRPLIRSHHHGYLIPAVMLAGASLVLICDLICQWPGAAQSLPLNAVTSLLGAPVVIALILKMRRLAA
jgi:iron complex transport system permease protein